VSGTFAVVAPANSILRVLPKCDAFILRAVIFLSLQEDWDSHMTEKRKPKFFYGYIIVSASIITTAVMWGTLYSFGVFFKPMLTEFGWTRAATSAAYSFCILLSAFLSIIMGRLTDRFGPRLVIRICGFSLGLGYLLMSQINAVWQLYVLYGVMVGIGISGAYAPLLATVGRWFIKRRGMMTGIASAGGAVGAMTIPPIVGWLISVYDWRTSYIITGIVALLLVVLAAQFLKRDPSQIGVLPYGGEQTSENGAELQASSFSVHEAMHTRQFWLLCAVFTCNLLPLSAMVVHVVVHAIGLGVLPTSAANIMAFMGIGGIVGRITLTSAADKVGNKLAMIIGFILMAVTFIWLMAAKEVWMLYLFGFVFGFASHSLIALIALSTVELFGLGSLGVLLGAVNSGGAIGEGIGPVLAGGIFDITGSYQGTFLLLLAISVTGIILSSLLRRTDKLSLVPTSTPTRN